MIVWLQWMAFQLEDKTLDNKSFMRVSIFINNLRKRADGSCNPGHDEHHLGPIAVGHVREGEHDSRETV